MNASIPAHLAAKGWHTPKERNYLPMPLVAVQLDTLPARTRAMSEDNTQLAADIAAVLFDAKGALTGAGASDGEEYADRKSAAKVGDRARRVFLRSKPTIPTGKSLRARYDETNGAWHWTLYITDATAKAAAK